MQNWMVDYAIVALVFALATGAIAEHKNQRPFAWALVGLLFAPIALMLVMVEDSERPYARIAVRATPATSRVQP
jgi:hypothetical protein